MVRLGVVFGSRSVEHEVSIISACQLMAAADTEKYTIVPLYIDKKGSWWTGEVLTDISIYKDIDLFQPQAVLGDKISAVNFSPDPTEDHGVDVVISALHGGMGEEGTISGLMALANIPFAAPGVTAAAALMDKVLTKHLATAASLPTLPYYWFTRTQWEQDRQKYLSQAAGLQYPLFVKPGCLGSSVGVTRVSEPEKLAEAIDLAATFDTRLIVEQGAHDCIEVNIAVMQTVDGPRVSVTEQPIKSEEFLTYQDKYGSGGKGSKSGGAKGMASLARRIPAPIAPTLTQKIESTALEIWRIIGGAGVARIDLFANPSTEEFYLNEINSPPGSMAFYLWEKSGVPYSEMIDLLVANAQAEATQRNQLSTSFESNILAAQSSGGTKQ